MKPPNPPSAPPHALTRSRSDRMLAGVAGGIARKYGFDPAYVRLAFVVATIFSLGAAIVAYVVAWLVVPESDADEPVLTTAVHRATFHPTDKRLWIGVILLIVGVNALGHQYGHRYGFFGPFARLFWPMVFIGAGAAVLLLRDRDVRPPSPPSPPPRPRPDGGLTPPGATVPGTDPSASAPAPSPASSTWPPGVPPVPFASAPADAPPAGAPPTDAPPTTPGFPFGAPPAEPPTAYPPTLPWPEPTRPRPPRRARRERSMLGRLTWSVLLVVLGIAWLVDLTGAANVDARFVLAVELGVVGVALVVGAWFGRAHGLIALALLLTVFAGAFSVLRLPLRGDIGEHIVAPQSLGDLNSKYRLGIGHLELDLTATHLDAHAHHIDLTDAIGFIEVRVPADARVEVIARSDTGSLDILGRSTIGGTHVEKTVIDDPFGTSGPRIVIDAHVGFGAVKVERELVDAP